MKGRYWLALGYVAFGAYLMRGAIKTPGAFAIGVLGWPYFLITHHVGGGSVTGANPGVNQFHVDNQP